MALAVGIEYVTLKNAPVKQRDGPNNSALRPAIT